MRSRSACPSRTSASRKAFHGRPGFAQFQGDAEHALLRRAAARLAAEDGRFAEAERLLAEGRTFIEGTNLLAERAEFEMAAAYVAARGRDTETARRRGERARDLYAAKGHVPGKARAEAFLASLTG